MSGFIYALAFFTSSFVSSPFKLRIFKFQKLTLESYIIVLINYPLSYYIGFNHNEIQELFQLCNYNSCSSIH